MVTRFLIVAALTAGCGAGSSASEKPTEAACRQAAEHVVDLRIAALRDDPRLLAHPEILAAHGEAIRGAVVTPAIEHCRALDALYAACVLAAHSEDAARACEPSR